MIENIDQFFKDIVAQNISDLHLAVGLPPMIRKNSVILACGEEAMTNEAIEKVLLAVLPKSNKYDLTDYKEIDLGITIEGTARFRVNIYHDRNGLCVAFRLIPQIIPSIESLGLPGAVRRTVELQRGLVLVTGPTGSGKSTTLAAIINAINQSRPCHIVTLEDPIEYLHNHKRSIINQREIGVDSPSFSQALRASLRQDPNVILVGEMRDLETISNAVTAAETGHLVFATLHTRNAAQSINRVIDVFPSEQQAQIRIQFADSIDSVISQILVPSHDGECRYLASEVMVATTAIRNLIRENKTYQIETIIESGSNEGMQTMDQSLKRLVEERKIDLRTAKKYAFTKSYFV